MTEPAVDAHTLVASAPNPKFAHPVRQNVVANFGFKGALEA